MFAIRIRNQPQLLEQRFSRLCRGQGCLHCQSADLKRVANFRLLQVSFLESSQTFKLTFCITSRTSFIEYQKVERQSRLMKEFGFMCDCKACSENFPTPPSLYSKDTKILKLAKKINSEILKLQPAQVMKKCRECCEVLNKTCENFPSIELCLLQKCIVTCLVKQAQPAVVFP